jgi:hypothetical protein
VIGGCLDDEFRMPSQELFRRFEAGDDVLVLSELTLKELQRAPEAVRAVLFGVKDRYIEEVEFTEEASDSQNNISRQA